MGNVAVAGRDDDVLFYNPAQLAIARGTTVSGGGDWNSFSAGALSSAMAFSSGGIGVGGMFSQTDVLVPVITPGGGGPGLAPIRMATILGSVGVAQVVKSVRVGLAGRYLGEQLSNQMRFKSRTMFDIGLARGFRQYFTGGLAVQNIGISGQDLPADAPTQATLGVAASGPLGPYDVIITAAMKMDDHDHHVRPAAGAEVGWSWLNGYNLALRVGVRDPIAQRPFTAAAGEGAFTAGLGFVADRVALDYGFEMLADSHTGHRIGVRVR